MHQSPGIVFVYVEGDQLVDLRHGIEGVQEEPQCRGVGSSFLRRMMVELTPGAALKELSVVRYWSTIAR